MQIKNFFGIEGELVKEDLLMVNLQGFKQKRIRLISEGAKKILDCDSKCIKNN